MSTLEPGQPVSGASVPASASSVYGASHHEAPRPTGSAGPADPTGALQRTTSTSSTKIDAATGTPTRNSTLKKNASLRRRGSLSRRSSRRSIKAGAIRGTGEYNDDDFNNVFHTPVPTSGNPTEILANRFQAWRKLLKDLVTYFREIQLSYENRSKALLKISNVINNTTTPPVFLTEGGLNDAFGVLRNFHKQSIAEANKARDIEQDVITQLNGLRSDLNQKIKEIKSLSGDFKNSVEKEKDSTRKVVGQLQDALDAAELESAAASGKGDPFIVRMHVDRQVERQLEEENYLHRAYLNLEGSGRELESIVVGEIQKAYNAYAGILKREADQAHDALDNLRAGPIAMPKDHEWLTFVEKDPHFINPNTPVRRVEDIHYPGKFNPAAAEIKSGMLERKSKYLKSYTPGWYVLSPTHLHEFKSADHIHTQTPIMSLHLLDQKLGSHSQQGATSHKFSLKGRQTGGMHRGHSWVFRAESFDTMMAWYEDIKNLTEKTGAEKTAYVRSHARSLSGGNNRPPSVSSDGLEDDEADAAPYSGTSASQDEVLEPPPKRPEPGGRFGSDVNINRDTQAPLSPSSESSDNQANDEAAAGATAGAFGIAGVTGAAAYTASRGADDGEAGRVAAQDHAATSGVRRPAPLDIAAVVGVHQPTNSQGEEIHELPSAEASAARTFNNRPMDGAGHSATRNDQEIAGGSAAGPAVAGGLAFEAHQKAALENAQSPDRDDPISMGIGVLEAPFVAVADRTPTPMSINSGADPFGTIANGAGAPSKGAAGDATTHPDAPRQTSKMSVSDFHVPGEFPPTSATL